MRKITVIGSKTEEGYNMARFSVKEGGGFTDQTRNTVYQILRKIPIGVRFWQWDDGSDLLFDNGMKIKIR